MKTWFITGGTPGGFGMAYAEAALELGDRVTLTSRRPEELEAWARPHGDRVLVLPLDVTDAKDVERAVRAAEDRFGGIDVLVNNAGRGWVGSIEGMADADVRRLFELNFFAVLSAVRAVLPGMRERGDGWIVTMSSVAGLTGVEGFGYYSAAKFALEAATEVLRAEVAPLGIRVLAVEPGAFRTRAYAGFSGEPVQEEVPDRHPPQTPHPPHRSSPHRSGPDPPSHHRCGHSRRLPHPAPSRRRTRPRPPHRPAGAVRERPLRQRGRHPPRPPRRHRQIPRPLRRTPSTSCLAEQLTHPADVRGWSVKRLALRSGSAG